jgi:hypothetical protein
MMNMHNAQTNGHTQEGRGYEQTERQMGGTTNRHNGGQTYRHSYLLCRCENYDELKNIM